MTGGTPEQIADLIVDWFYARAADGFNLMPPILPTKLDVSSQSWCTAEAPWRISHREQRRTAARALLPAAPPVNFSCEL